MNPTFLMLGYLSIHQIIQIERRHHRPAQMDGFYSLIVLLFIL
jgi:hypothetical protein